MAVVGLAIGGVLVGAVLYDDHSDHSDYSDYSNYSNYSDAAERKRRRIAAKEEEISSQEQEVNTYKIDQVNDYLQSVSLKQQSGVEVDAGEVKKDGDAKIDQRIRTDSDRESAEVVRDMENIDKVLKKIDQILEEGE